MLMKAASQINANLPVMVDSETRLDSTVGMNRQFLYRYMLVNFSASELDAVQIADAMRPQLTNLFCTSPQMKVFVEHNVPVTYSYYGKAGQHVTSITINSSMCSRG